MTDRRLADTPRHAPQAAGALAFGASRVRAIGGGRRISGSSGPHRRAVRGGRPKRPDGPAVERQAGRGARRDLLSWRTEPAPAATSAPRPRPALLRTATQLLVTSSAFVVNPGLYKQVPYDPVKDFAPVTELGPHPTCSLQHLPPG